jgi:hypothetical protein
MSTPEEFHVGGFSGGLETPEFLRDFAAKTVGTYQVFFFCLLVVLVIVVLWLVIKGMTDHFNPTQNMRDQDSDQFGLGKRKEGLDTGPTRDKSLFAQWTQSSAGAAPAVVGPLGAAGTPGTAAYQVLHSAEFDCANRKPMTEEGAWGWLTGAAGDYNTGRENLAAKPQTDNEFSKKMAGL